MLFRYLIKDACIRAQAAPVKTLTKLFIAGLLTGFSGVILLSFHITERNIDQRLEKIGTDTIILREHLDLQQTARGLAPLQDHLRLIKGHAASYFLSQAHLSVRTATDTRPILFAYRNEDIRTDYLSSDQNNPLIYFDPKFPPGIQLKLEIEKQPFIALSASPPNWLKKLTTEPTLIAPDSFYEQWPQAKRGNYFAVFEVNPENGTTAQISQALKSLKQSEDRDGVWIYDASQLLDEKETLNHQQNIWRLIILFGFGITISLILSSIAIFEYRESRYITALLKSFGVKTIWIYFQFITESLILANIGLWSAILILSKTWIPISLSLGFQPSLLEAIDFTAFIQIEGLWIFAFIHCGVVISSIPFLMGARNPVGIVLE